MNWIKSLINNLAHALHHLFNPHCELCDSLLAQKLQLEREHELELRVCQSCETLKTQLEFQNQLIRELTSREITEETIPAHNNHQPISPRHKPWAVRRAELEKADRELSRKLREEKLNEVTVDSLDEELNAIRTK